MGPGYFEVDISLEEFLSPRDLKNDFDGGMFSGITIDNMWKEEGYCCYQMLQEQLVVEQFLLPKNQYYQGGEEGKTFSG